MKKLSLVLLIFFMISSYTILTAELFGETGDILKTITTDEAQLNALAVDGQGDLWLNRPVSLQSYLFEVTPRGKTRTEFSSTYTEYTGMVWISPFLCALSTSSPNRIHLLNLDQQEIAGDIRIPEEHCSLLAFDGNCFWTFSGMQRKLLKLDWQGNQLAALDPADDNLTGMGFKDGVLWQISAGVEKTTLFKTNPQTGEVVSSFDVDKRLQNLTFYGDELWAVEYFQGNAHLIEAEVLSSTAVAHHWNLKGSLLLNLTVEEETQRLKIPFREEFILKSDGSCAGIALEGQWLGNLFAVSLELNGRDFANDFLYPLFISLGYEDLQPEDVQFDAQSIRMSCIPLLGWVVWGVPHIQGRGLLGGKYQNVEYTINAIGMLVGKALAVP